MTDPFYPAKPGDPITAEKWNDMQVKLRDESSGLIGSHTHTGGAEGRKLTGDSIDPTSVLKVNQLDAILSLSVQNVDVLERLERIDQTKLHTAGGTISGKLGVSGAIGIGTSSPVAKLDIHGAARQGDHSAAAKGRPLYVTGDFGEADGVEFKHSDGRQGIGLGSNTLYAAGSTTNQPLKLQARGVGIVQVLSSLEVRGGSASTQPNAVLRLQTTETSGRAQIELNCMATTSDHRKWRLEVDGTNGLSIRQYAEGGAERLMPLTIAARDGAVSIKKLSVTDTLSARAIFVETSPGGPVAYGHEQLRIIRGCIQTNTNSSGAGYTARWINTSVCELSFASTFNAPPVVVVTPCFPGKEGMGFELFGNAVITECLKNKCLIKTGRGADGAGIQLEFFFIVMGN